MPASPVELENSLPDLDFNPRQRESSARQASRHCGLLTVVEATEPLRQAPTEQTGVEGWPSVSSTQYEPRTK